MNSLTESVTVSQLQLADALALLPTGEGRPKDYYRRLGVEKQQRGRLEALLCSLRSRSVDHTSLGDSVRGFLHQKLDSDPDVNLWAIFAAVRDRTTIFRYATSHMVETLNATICHYGSSNLTHLDSIIVWLLQPQSPRSRRLPIR